MLNSKVPENPDVIHPIYLPFTADELRKHFDPLNGTAQIDKHIAYYVTSANRYKNFCAVNPDRRALPLHLVKKDCQIEKDERFWSVACWMSLFHHEESKTLLCNIMARCFPSGPPVEGLTTWSDCFDGKLHLFFEPYLPAPKSYKAWLSKHIRKRHLIPYVFNAALQKGCGFEGPTHVDALVINEKNGFAVLVEAKVMSDISAHVSFDAMRNQLSRCIDVALEQPNAAKQSPLSKRQPSRTLVILQTPTLFRNNPHTRLYGSLWQSYKNAPTTLGRDLPHRDGIDWNLVAKRIGWLTWEDCNRELSSCCAWCGPR